MSLASYNLKKSKKVLVREFYKANNISKTGLKNLPRSGLTALERKSKGHQWDKLKGSDKIPKWKAWGVMKKEEVKWFGETRYDEISN